MESFNGRFRKNSCRQSLPEATYWALLIFSRDKVIGRAAPNQVQHLQTAFGAPRAYAPGSPPAIESGLMTHQLS